MCRRNVAAVGRPFVGDLLRLEEQSKPKTKSNIPMLTLRPLLRVPAFLLSMN